MNTESPTPEDQPSRPWSVTITAVGVFILAAFYITRVAGVLRRWDFYAQVLLPYANVYLLVSGILWGAAALILTFGLWTGRGWALKALKVGVGLYFLYDWIDRLVITQLNAQAINWLFILMIEGIIFAWLLLNFSRPTVKQFFGEQHEQ